MSTLINIIELSMMQDINRMTTSSHNISNISTNSYKREMTGNISFDAFVTMDNYNNVPKVVINRGIKYQNMTDFSSSAVKATSNPLDLSIRSNGFFVVRTEQGEAYTRNGNFRMDEQGRLVTQAGYPVEGESGEIRLTTSDPRITRDGEIWDGDNRLGKLSVVEFDAAETSGLSKLSNGLYESETGFRSLETEPEIQQGYLEGSNVDSAYEMINTVETLRHFELNQRLLHMQQEMYKSSLDSLGNF